MDLEQKALQIRQLIFKTIYNGGGGHGPTSLSMVEILTVLYYEILRIDPIKPNDPDRDRFILSKGHGGVALYAILADMGFFPEHQLKTFGQNETDLGGHPDMHKVPGIEASTGALGHGFPFSVGIALAGKMDKIDFRVFSIVGDGECQEGSIWEAALFAPAHRLDNLICIVDYNKFQAMDRLDSIIPMDPFAEKWRSFGWAVEEVDGHNMNQLLDLLKRTPLQKGKPTLIIAHTTKGKGVSFMENTAIWHYRMPQEEEMIQACRDLGLEFLNGTIR